MGEDGRMTEQPTVTVSRNESTHRFEARLDGVPAGFVDYKQRGNEVVLIHTETLSGFEGRGVGGALARFALDEIRERGEKAVVLCPFIKTYLARHPEYNDVVVRVAD
jgi:predicted GNAT family acetyltransferase